MYLYYRNTYIYVYKIFLLSIVNTFITVIRLNNFLFIKRILKKVKNKIKLNITYEVLYK